MSSYYEKMLATGEVKCIDEEIPFDVPQGWEWCRLGELISYQNGYAYTSSELNKEGKGLPVIKSGNLMTYEVVLKPNNDYVENPSTKMLASAIKKGDLLMCLSSQSDNPEPLGKTAIYKVNNTALLNQRVLKMRPWLEDMLEYIYYAINSEYFHYTVSHQGGGSAQANLKLGHVLSMLIPLAPLKEEIRIVDKINTIMPLVHQYETTFLKQKKLNSELNDRLKSAILQEAIQGKLVPQIAEEGTAKEQLEQIKVEKQKLVKEGKLKKSSLNDSVIFRGGDSRYYEKIGKKCVDITEEIPFEIPNNWAWSRLSSMCSIVNGFTPLRSESRFWDCGTINWFTVEDIKNQGEIIYSTKQKITDEATSKERIVRAGSVLLCCTASVGQCALAKIDLTTNQQFNALTVKDVNSSILTDNYLFWFAKTLKPTLHRLSGKTTFEFVSVKKVGNILIPLPPLKEQQRIVAQIEKLFEQLH